MCFFLLAVNAQQVESVRVLLSYRARVNTRDKQDRTALHLAAAGGSVEIVKLLLDSDADCSVIDYKVSSFSSLLIDIDSCLL